MKAPVCPSCQNPLPPPGALPFDYAVAAFERVLRTRVGQTLAARALRRSVPRK